VSVFVRINVFFIFFCDYFSVPCVTLPLNGMSLNYSILRLYFLFHIFLSLITREMLLQASRYLSKNSEASVQSVVS